MMIMNHLKRVLAVLLSLPLLSSFAGSEGFTGKVTILESPKGAALRVKVVPGLTVDRLERAPMKESPKGAALRVRRVPGVTPDRIDRGVPKRSPRSEVNFPAFGRVH
jgi:hypothetical protein